MNRAKFCVPVLVLTFVVCGSRAAEAQVRASTDWLFWTRNHDSDSEFLTGAAATDEADFGFSSGFRFSLGASFDRFDVEASFLQIPDWDETASGVLAVPLAFDDPTNAFIAPAAGFGFPNALSVAADDIPNMEDLEIEHLEAGATISQRLVSRLRDFELNVGTSRSVRNVWASLGWRHIEINETSTNLAVGIFQAIDVDDGAFPGDLVDDDPNNGLSGGALTAAGFVNIAGAGDGFVGYDPLDPMAIQTTLGALFQGYSDNDLDGGHIVVGGRFQPAQLLILEGFFKAGVFQNRATGLVQETIFGVENDTSVYRRTFFDRKTTASFAGSLGFRVIVPVTDYINIRTGYEAMLVTNVAVGADQSQGISTDLLGVTRYEVVTSAYFLAHGGHLGLELNW